MYTLTPPSISRSQGWGQDRRPAGAPGQGSGREPRCTAAGGRCRTAQRSPAHTFSLATLSKFWCSDKKNCTLNFMLEIIKY